MTFITDDTEVKESGTEEESDDLAAEWAAMLDEDDENGTAEGKDGDDSEHNDSRLGRTLDQDEIDSLLGFDDGSDSFNRNGIEAIINSALVSYERLPMLEVVYDRVIRLMSTSLRNFTSDNVDVSIDGMSAVRFGDYLNSIPLPAMLSVFKAEEWDNYGLIVVNSSLIYSIVDVLLGGRRGMSIMAIEGRPYTTIELTLVERMVNIILADLSAAFEPLHGVNFRFDRIETNPRFAAITQLTNAAILARFRVDMEERGGYLDLIIPYSTLEPVRELLLQMFLGEKFGRDSIWESHLATQLWTTKVPISAIIKEQNISLNEVLNWKIGSKIMLNIKKDSPVLLRCGNVDIFEADIGKNNEKIAVQVRKRLRGGQKKEKENSHDTQPNP